MVATTCDTYGAPSTVLKGSGGGGGKQQQKLYFKILQSDRSFRLTTLHALKNGKQIW